MLTDTLKGVKPDEFGMWPSSIGTRDLPFSLPFGNLFLFNDTPQWNYLSGLQSLFDWYHSNPVFYSIVMIKAKAYANMRIKVINRNTGKEEDPIKTRVPIAKKLYRLFREPNLLQNTWEFWMQRKIFEDVAGNSFTYGNFSSVMQPNITSIADQGLWNVWPAGMKYKLGGKFFDATELKEIIKGWEFEVGNYKKTWEPHEILHINKPNTDYRDSEIFGRSPAYSLHRPLSNIDMAYEARNVIMANRGMRGIISSNKGDASGKVAMNKKEKDKTHQMVKDYGFLQAQKQWMISDVPINVTMVDQDVNKLGLFDEIATDGIICCHGWGVPELLLKLYLKGSTFENLEASMRRLYQETLIPEADNDISGISKFLKLEDTDWMLISCFDHVAALQESERKRAEAHEIKVRTLLAELAAGALTMDEYRMETGRPKLEKKEEEEKELV